MKTIILSLALVSFLIQSCGNDTKDDSNKPTEASKHNEHQQDDKNESIELKNGEKWRVNEEMKPFIREAEDVLDQYIANHSQDYRSLSAQLKEKNNALIKSCTMKGESHDELHKWLHPHINLIESLSKAESTGQANRIISDLKASFSTYHKYFQ